MRKTVKLVLHRLCQILVLPLIVLYKCCSIRKDNDALFMAMGQLLALVPGKTGSFLRVAFYSCTAQSVASDVHIAFGSFLPHPAVVLEPGIYIGAYCIIAQCHIGRGTLIGSCVNILSGSRQHLFDDPDKPIQSQGRQNVTVRIGPDCWIGNNVVVMADVGDHTVIGAAAVVVKPIPSYSVAVGNPCRVIKNRLESAEVGSES